MAGDSSKSLRDNVIPLKLKDVTSNCISILKTVPYARANEHYNVPNTLLNDKLIPQENESIFLKIYVSQKIINNNKIEVTSTSLFPNYQGRIFELELNGVKQLILVGISNELELDLGIKPNPFPFLLYIPPSPQDNAKNHQKMFINLYKNTKENDIPYFYKDTSGYPYSWDWLFFQFYSNMYKLSYQLKKANKPFVFVVPMIKNFSEGLGLLNSATVLEQCLVGIQKFILDEKLKENNYYLEDVKHLILSSFSIGNSILSNFIIQNRNTRLIREKLKDFFIYDPPFNNPNNRSTIIDSIISLMRADTSKSILLYTQDAYYIQPLIQNFLIPNKINFDLRKDKIFSDPKVKRVFFAYLEPPLFVSNIQDPLIKDVHNTFPNLFINNAASRCSLGFSDFMGKRLPDY